MLNWDDNNCDKSAATLLARIEGRTRKISINWNGVPLACEYEYTPGEPGTRIDPPVPEGWDIIEARTVTGYDMIGEHPSTYDSILAEIIEQLDSQQTYSHGRRRA
jgi:hypothetical protein